MLNQKGDVLAQPYSFTPRILLLRNDKSITIAVILFLRCHFT
jgi:hypothetical protein